VDLFIRSGSGVDPYFRLLMSDPQVGWKKVWFFLMNDIDALHPVVTCSCPVPQPKWGYGVAQRDIRRLQPLRDFVQHMLRSGLMGVDLLWTFVGRRIQPLRRVGQCGDQRPDLRNPCSWSSLSYACANFCFFNVYTFLCKVLGMRTAPRVGLPCLRMRYNGGPTMPRMRGSRHRGTGGGFRVSSGRPRGSGGRKHPLSPNPREMVMRRRMKTSKRVRKPPLPSSPPKRPPLAW
jgi:hypothetical protein